MSQKQQAKVAKAIENKLKAIRAKDAKMQMACKQQAEQRKQEESRKAKAKRLKQVQLKIDQRNQLIV